MAELDLSALKRLLGNAEEEGGTVYNKKAIDALKADKAAQADMQAQLAAGSDSPLTQRMDLSGIDKSKLPASPGPSDGSLAVNPMSASVGDTIPNDAQSIKLDPNQDVTGNAPAQSPLATKWAQLKNAAPYAGAAAAGTALGLMSGDGSSPQAQKAMPASDDSEDDESDDAPSAAVAAKSDAKADDSEDSEDEQDQSENSDSEDNKKVVAAPQSPTPPQPQNLASVQKLQDLQNKMQQTLALNSAGRTAAATTYAMAGRANPFDKQFEDEAKQAALPVQNYLQATDFQKQDPNSAVSQTYRQLAKYIDPDMQVSNQTSAADLEKINPELGNIKSREDLISAKRDIASERASDQRYKNEVLASNAQDKKDNQQLVRYNQTIQQLEQMRGSPAVSQAEKDIYAAQKVNTLVNSMGGDPNKLNPQQVQLLVSEVGKIASGGQSSEAGLSALTPATLTGKLANAWQQLKNSPQPANAGAFVKQYQDYANNLTKDAQSVIKDRYGRIIGSRASQFSPDQLDNLNSLYTNRFDGDINNTLGGSKSVSRQQKGPATNTTPSKDNSSQQDPKINAYAQQNNLDYNTAAQILKSRGYNAQ